MKKIISLALLIAICSLSFAWDVVRQAAFPTNFYCMEKVGSTIWAGGYVGGVAKSTDDGLTWQFVVTPAYTPPTYKDVWDIDFINQNQGIMVGDDGMAALTTDGGLTWNTPAALTSIITSNRIYGAEYFADGRIWICGAAGMIAYSPDYGVTWSQQGAGLISTFLYDISMSSSGVGFAACNKGTPSQSKILKTTDFGQTWSIVTFTLTGTPSMFKIRQYGTKVVMVGDYGYLGYSNDSGETWTHYVNAAGTTSSDQLRDVVMNGDEGYAVGRNARILKTTDGWQTYTLLTHDVSTYIEGIKYRDDGSLIECGWQGTIDISHDGGLSWQEMVSTAVDIWQVSVVDANTWYMAGDKGNILKTVDGGQTVVKKNVPGIADLYYAVYFKNALEGWVTGKTTGKIYHTTDGGDTWTLFTIPGFSTTKAYYDFFFINDTTGYLLGVGGKVAKTTDGGLTWSLLGDNIGSTLNLYCNYWKSESNGYAGSGSGALYITTNGGVNWSSITVGASANIRDIWFRDANNGVLVKENGEIYYTTTGGNTAGSWIAATESATAAIMGVMCDHNGVYWAAGYSSDASQNGNTWALMKSLDYGATWTQETFPPLSFNATRFTNISTGGGKIVAVGKNNLVVAQLEIPEHVTLTSPANSSSGLDPAHVDLSWTPSEYGSVAAFYQVFVSDAEENIFDQYYFETPSTSFDLSAALQAEGHDLGYNALWYWAVLPVNELLDYPDPTADNFMIWRFTTMDEPVSSLEAPILNIHKVDNQVSVYWAAVPHAVTYRVMGCNTPDGTYTEITRTSNTDYTIVAPGAMQFFKVIASTDARFNK